MNTASLMRLQLQTKYHGIEVSDVKQEFRAFGGNTHSLPFEEARTAHGKPTAFEKIKVLVKHSGLPR